MELKELLYLASQPLRQDDYQLQHYFSNITGQRDSLLHLVYFILI